MHDTDCRCDCPDTSGVGASAERKQPNQCDLPVTLPLGQHGNPGGKLLRYFESTAQQAGGGLAQ